MSVERESGSWATSSNPSSPRSPLAAPRAGRRLGLLFLLAAIPLGAGAVRLHELATGAVVSAENVRFLAAPLPVVVHIVAASSFAVLGALQVVAGMRARKPGLHRRLGWLLVPCGMLLVVSGLWMQTFAPPPRAPHALLVALRWLFGATLFASLWLGTRAALRRDFATHGAWMLRAYAVAMGAGTQSFLLVPWVVLVGPPPALPEALLMGAGWTVNLLVAEWLLRQKSWRAAPAVAARATAPSLRV